MKEYEWREKNMYTVKADQLRNIIGEAWKNNVELDKIDLSEEEYCEYMKKADIIKKHKYSTLDNAKSRTTF